jgi:hypothetical protein
LASPKFFSPLGFIAPAQSASRPLPLANPFRHFPNGSNPKRLKSITDGAYAAMMNAIRHDETPNFCSFRLKQKWDEGLGA